LNSLDQISRVSTRILLKEPFYGHFMLGMPKAMDDTIDTACVSLISSNIVKLSVNSKFWASLSDNHQYGLIKHEILHVVLRHLFIQRDFGNKYLFNIAADLVVNQYIAETQIPDGAVRLSTFWYLKPLYGIELKPLQSTAYYYKNLLASMQQPPSRSLADFEAEHGKITRLSDLLDQLNENQKKHAMWGQFGNLGKAEVKIMEYQLYNHVKNVMERLRRNPAGLGHLPGHFIEYLESFLDSYKPQVDWKRVLKKFAASSTSSFIKNTLRRTSKRYGTTPGIKVRRHHKLLIALDTSGSLPHDDIKTFFGELHQIWRQGADVIITECDAEIKKTYAYMGELPDKIHGRGGTNFTPPISLANKEIRPDGIIYFTDGQAGPPAVKSRCPILWVITSNGAALSSVSTLPGQKVKMYNNA
jgi:predicted metal-dependent peptidase